MAQTSNFTVISGLIGAASTGGGFPSEELLPLVYDELRDLAARRLAGHGSTGTLQASALVHEARLRLAGANARPWNSKAYGRTLRNDSAIGSSLCSLAVCQRVGVITNRLTIDDPSKSAKDK
jgi:hypothetical protein